MYLPFARKWRPQDFDEIIGQGHIATILKNAISMGRVHHAYLFAGPRGIGKTSTARILSKALNCEKGISPKPCNQCVSCNEITSGSSMDVIEIDGASNRGIDEIRNLREAVKFSPSKGQYKIYIIDEVHMLTQEAFNALLKTLEEPPRHVKFIFATTQPHKIPATILSRCQRFDFRRIPIRDIVAKLQEIARQEKLDIEESAFLYIARASDGSMRDAESILDQVSSFSEGKIHLKDIIESLGMIDEEELLRCSDSIINRDTKAALCLVDQLLNSGKDLKEFLFEVLEHFRNIMVAKLGVSSEDGLIDLPKETISLIKKQAQLLSKGDIFYIVNVISSSLRMMKQLLPERIVLELCMIKLTSRDSIASIEELLSRLPQLPEVSKAEPIVKVEKVRETVSHDVEPKASLANAIAEVSLSRIKDAWPILIKAMAVKKMSLSSYLREAEPDSVRGNTINVSFPKELNFHREILEETRNKHSIETELSQILDTSVKLQFIAVDKKVENPEPESNPESKKTEPIVDTALNIFGGKVLKNIKDI